MTFVKAMLIGFVALSSAAALAASSVATSTVASPTVADQPTQVSKKSKWFTSKPVNEFRHALYLINTHTIKKIIRNKARERSWLGILPFISQLPMGAAYLLMSESPSPTATGTVLICLALSAIIGFSTLDLDGQKLIDKTPIELQALGLSKKEIATIKKDYNNLIRIKQYDRGSPSAELGHRFTGSASKTQALTSKQAKQLKIYENKKYSHGYRLAHIAAIKNDVPLVHYLFTRAKFDMSVRDDHGHTPFDLAAVKGNYHDGMALVFAHAHTKNLTSSSDFGQYAQRISKLITNLAHNLSAADTLTSETMADKTKLPNEYTQSHHEDIHLITKAHLEATIRFAKIYILRVKKNVDQNDDLPDAAKKEFARHITTVKKLIDAVELKCQQLLTSNLNPNIEKISKKYRSPLTPSPAPLKLITTLLKSVALS